MKLYNKTKCPKNILKPLLVLAGKSIGARTSKVVIKITQGRSFRVKGIAYKAYFVYSWHLRNLKSRRKGKHNLGRLINTDGGWIELTLPKLYRPERMKCWPTTDGITLAQRFFKVAQHEFAHIKDYQNNNFIPTPTTNQDRRIPWKNRPCEISAMNQVNDAKILNTDNIILELALYFEKESKK